MTVKASLCAIGAVFLLLSMPQSFASQANEKPLQIAEKSKDLSTKEIQQRLQDLGFKPGAIDGVVGKKLEAALRAFQLKAGIQVTGKVDADTMKELIASGEAKMLHSLPAALLPANTALENFGTKVILRPVKEREGVMVLVMPRRGGYQHKLQFLGLTKDGRAHVESTVWTEGAIHEIDEPLTMAGYEFVPAAGKTMTFRVDRRKGYVFVNGDGLVTPPDGPTMIFGPYQQNVSVGRPAPKPSLQGTQPKPK